MKPIASIVGLAFLAALTALLVGRGAERGSSSGPSRASTESASGIRPGQVAALDLRTLEQARVGKLDRRPADRRPATAELSLRVTVETFALDGMGQPPSFRLQIEGPLQGPRSAVVHTVEHGVRTEIELDLPGRYALSAAADGFLSSTTLVDAQLGADPVDVLLLVEPGRAVSGVVMDTRGRAVTGATVVATGGGAALPLEATSTTDGSFRLTIPHPRPMARSGVLVLAEGYCPSATPLDDDATALELVLQHGWDLAGRVVDDRGLPVPGAEVRWRSHARLPARAEAWVSARPARTDREGGFTLTAVPPGSLTVEATAPGHAPTEQRVGPESQDVPMILTLRSGHELAGRVLDHLGNPVDGARIDLAAETGGHPTRHTRSGRDGAFVVASVAPGEWLVSASAGGSSPITATVTVPSGGPLALRLGAPATLTGEVFLERQERYRISLVDFEGNCVTVATFETPRFVLCDVVPGHYLARIARAGRPPEDIGPVALTAGKTTELGVVATMPGASVTGVVAEEDTGFPLDAAISLFGDDGSGSGRRATLATTRPDRDGAFAFDGLAAGSYDVLVRPIRGAAVHVEDLELDGRESLDLGWIGVSTGATLELRVLGLDGAPLAGTCLSIGDGEGGYARTTDSRGRLRMEGLTAGQVFASLVVDGVPRSITGQVRAGETTDLTLDLSSQTIATWSARLLGGDGIAADGLHVRAVAADGSWMSDGATTAGDGDFTLRGALSGRARLEIVGLGPGYERVCAPIDFAGPGLGPATIHVPGS